MTMPNFLIIGAAKSGTSAIWRYLPQHPDIYMSSKKEPHFFAYENETPDASGPGDFTKFAKTDLASYQALFDDVRGEKAIGEAATTSLYLPRSMERIHHYIPNARFIAILRQPADRAYSAFMHLRRDKREPVSDFRQALALEDVRISKNWGFMWHYTKMGYYYEQLRRFYDLFNRNQIRVYIYDDFVANPASTIQDMYDFLGVDKSFIPDTKTKANVSGVHKSVTADKIFRTLFDRQNPIRSLSRRLVSDDQRYRLTTSARNFNLVRKKLSPSLRDELTSIFQEDILNLRELIEQDLSHWLESSR